MGLISCSRPRPRALGVILACGLLLAACAPPPEVIVMAPTVTLAGPVVPTRIPTVETALTAPTATLPEVATSSNPLPASDTPTPPPPSVTSAPVTSTPVPATSTPSASPTAQPTATQPSATPTTDPSVMTVSGQRVLVETPLASVGTTWTGTLDSTTPWAVYPVSGAPSDRIDLKVDAHGSGLLPMLHFLDADGRELARNGVVIDSDQGLIRGAELTDDRPHYVVVARRFGTDGFDQGDFELTISAGDPAITAGVFSNSIGADSLESASISPNTPIQLFTFEGQAGDVLSAQATRLSGDLDPRLELRSPLGTVLAVNDDDPAGATLDSAIARFTLPADGFYTLGVTGYGTTAGDFRLKLTHDATELADTFAGRLNYTNSVTLRDNGVLVTDFRAGDQVTAEGAEQRVQTLLTFELPDMPDGVQPGRAQLVLESCTEGGAGFDALGALRVYADSFGDLNGSRDYTRPQAGARVIAEISTCEPIDVTDVVAEAYAAGDSRVQFRLAFPAANNSGQSDEVRFDPRLVISAGA